MNTRQPTFAFACLTLFTVISVIAGGMIFFKLSLHLLMMTCWVICAIYAKFLGFTYADLEKGANELIYKAMGAVIILMCVGALIGAWIVSGTVPVMIYSGLKIISPTFFLLTSMIICSLTSLMTGTSWGTIGTVGIAIMGIGAGLGFEPGLTAAVIISGAFFGDKLSPLSDTTNMSAAVTGTPILRHIRHMVNTLTPAYIIVLIIYTIMGLQHDTTAVDLSMLNDILTGIEDNFKISIIPVLPMVFVLVLLLRQTNPALAIISGALFGVAIAVFYNGIELNTAFNAMWSGYKGDFEHPFLAKLLNRGGITSMLNIAALVIFACGLGGMLRCMGVIDTVLEPIAKRATSAFSLTLATLFVGYVNLLLTAAIYFSIVMTGTIMTPLFKKNGYRPENCSRLVEDATTFGGPLVPWASNALFPMATLSVTYGEYIPYVFLLYLTPLVSIAYALFNINMTKLSKEEMEEEQALQHAQS